MQRYSCCIPNDQPAIPPTDEVETHPLISLGNPSVELTISGAIRKKLFTVDDSPGSSSEKAATNTAGSLSVVVSLRDPPAKGSVGTDLPIVVVFEMDGPHWEHCSLILSDIRIEEPNGGLSVCGPGSANGWESHVGTILHHEPGPYWILDTAHESAERGGPK